MADEKTFIIPFRKEFLKVPRYKRSQKAVSALRTYLQKHMKTEEIKIGPHLNRALHEHGKRNPPSKIKVKVIREGSVVKTELPEFPFQEKKKEEKKGKLQTLKDKVLAKEEPKETEKQKEIREEEKILEQQGLHHGKEKHPERLLPTKEQDEKIRESQIITKSQKPTHEKKK